MRNHPIEVLNKLQERVNSRHRIVVSAITYSELRYGAIGKKASPKHNIIVNDFMQRIDSIMAWDKNSVDESTHIKKYLSDLGKPIGNNDIAIAGNALAKGCILVTNNVSEFSRVPHLIIEDWVGLK
jgi:tRNA(fMet)-specific endonuclease VapC